MRRPHRIALADRIDRIEEARRNGVPVINRGTPTRTAEDFLAGPMAGLIYVQGLFFEVHDGAYRPLHRETVRSRLQRWVASAVDVRTGGPLGPNMYDLNRIMASVRQQAFRAEVRFPPPVPADASPPTLTISF